MQALQIAEMYELSELYREASRFVLDSMGECVCVRVIVGSDGLGSRGADWIVTRTRGIASYRFQKATNLNRNGNNSRKLRSSSWKGGRITFWKGCSS